MAKSTTVDLREHVPERIEMGPRDAPLSIDVDSNRLTISVGIDTLARAIAGSPDDRLTPYNEETGEFDNTVITDPDVFARAVATALEIEEEDGTTPVHRLLDNAACEAIDQGAEGVRCPGDDR